jgi:hypothetical protein
VFNVTLSKTEIRSLIEDIKADYNSGYKTSSGGNMEGGSNVPLHKKTAVKYAFDLASKGNPNPNPF